VRTLVVGVGNDFRGDDGAGIAVARELRLSALNGVEIVELNGEVTGLLDRLDGFDRLILIDAIRSQSSPGTIHRIDASRNPVPDDRSQRSTHGISIGSVIEIARAQNMLPQHVLVFGIEGATFDHGAALTPKVEHSVKSLVKEITRMLDSSNS
jgi:hydrogenase maturation protease